MIFDKLENAGRYFSINPLFEAAFKFLMQEGLTSMECGTYEIEGKNLYAMISEAPGKKREDTKLETHIKYIDIQFLIDGSEEIGWNVLSECKTVTKEYKPEKDIMFFADEAQTYFKFTPGSFAIFFPEDAHAPMVSEGNVKKVVIKVIV